MLAPVAVLGHLARKAGAGTKGRVGSPRLLLVETRRVGDRRGANRHVGYRRKLSRVSFDKKPFNKRDVFR